VGLDNNASNAYNAVSDCTWRRDMASISIRDLDERTKTRLRVRAAQHGRSMEEEARTLLRAALREDPVAQGNLADAIRARFRRLGGVELRLPAREPMREPPKLGR
jgi:plasmid stability protein